MELIVMVYFSHYCGVMGILKIYFQTSAQKINNTLRHFPILKQQ